MADEETTESTSAVPEATEEVAEDITAKTVDGTKYPITRTVTDTSVTVVSDNYLAAQTEDQGRVTLSISRRGWVGPAQLVVHPDDKGELIALLKAL